MIYHAEKLRNILHKARDGKFPLIFVIPGSGLTARHAVEGGAQFLMILNAGLYRMAGVGSLGSFLPYGNANDQTEQLLRNQILPRVRNVPLVAGVMANDPTMPLARRFNRLSELGITGIVNWPATGLVDGAYGQALAEAGFSLEAEVEMIKEAKARGFVTFGFVLTAEAAAAMAACGTDGLVLNAWWTRESIDIYEKNDRIEHFASHINKMLTAVRATGMTPTCLFYGGPVLLPEDSAVIYQRTGVHGFGGGSSIERIPVAKLIVDNVKKFSSVPRKADIAHPSAGMGKIIGASPTMAKLYQLIKRIAPFDVSICIEGESGVGKELVANQIHFLSYRKSQPFITLNCGAIPDALLEAEFFGHEKGAFTGAVSRRLGKFELADQGTLFLDEVAELSPKAQVSLLRVLQHKEITRVGGEKAIRVDPRIITATHQSLKTLVEQGRFRADLHFRLNMMTLQVPPLRQRLHDIPALVDYFVDEMSLKFDRKIIGVSQDFMTRLLKHSWAGNVRELQHVIAKAILLEDGPILLGEDFIPDPPSADKKASSGLSSQIDASGLSVRANLVRNALKTAGGNKTKAAKLLGISRKTLYAHLAQDKIDP
jgi:DNA-binding NtrC family response regulator/predicted TIM-barrel enzyme